MGNFLKQPQQTKKRESRALTKKTPVTPAQVVVTGPDTGYGPSPSMQHDINHIAGLSDVEASLDRIARSLSRLTNDEHAVGLSVAQGSNANPIKVTLADNDFDDTMDRLVTAFERIADSISKLVGFNGPRLERRYEESDSGQVNP